MIDDGDLNQTGSKGRADEWLNSDCMLKAEAARQGEGEKGVSDGPKVSLWHCHLLSWEDCSGSFKGNTRRTALDINILDAY